MRPECRAEVSTILGRKLTDAEANGLVGDIRLAMGSLSKSDPAWSSMTVDDRVRAAGESIAKQYQANARQKKFAMQKQIVRQAECLREYKRLVKDEDVHSFKAVAQIMNSSWKRGNAVANEYLSQMLDTISGMKGKFFGLVEDAGDVRDFCREAFGENTGNGRAHQAWVAFDKVANAQRDRLVANGAIIGKLDHYIPQSHDAWKVRKAARVLRTKGADARSAWVDFISPLIDRERYVDDDGAPMTDGEFRQMLERSFDDIVTGGNPDPGLTHIAEEASKRTGNGAGGMKKYESRQLFFKDADSYLAYEEKFGNGSFSGVLIGHVQKMSQDISLIETFGPNAASTYDYLKKIATGEAQSAVLTETSNRRLSSEFSDIGLDAIWNNLTGQASQVAINHEQVAAFFQGFRNIQVIGKLGKAFISSLSDIPSYFVATRFNNMDFMQGLKFLPLAYGKDWSEYASRMGIMAEGMVADFNRWSGENLMDGWTGKLANLTMKASFLTQFTDATRRAFALNMSACAGKLIKTAWSDLSAYDRARLESAGISATDWDIFRSAGTTKHKGIDFLDPAALRAFCERDGALQAVRAVNPGVTADDMRMASSKLLSWIVAESEMASLNPDLISRSMTNLGTQKGSFTGEIARSFFLFKGFPIAYMRQHIERAAWLKRHGTRANRMEYIAEMVLSTTIFGALSLQVQQLLNGKDLQDMSTEQFWLSAMTKGGGLGFLGDFIANGLDDNSRYGAWGTIQFLGPIAGDVLEGYDLTTSVLDKGLYDKETKPAARAVRFARSHLPFVNMWYTSLIIDRYVMNDLQESLSPGYLQKMESRARNGYGQGFWWRPGQSEPSRVPKFAKQPH